MSVLPLAALLLAASPADAQLAGSVSLQSNVLFRGETVSSDDPGVVVGVNYDGPAGVYFGGSVTMAAGASEPHIATADQYAGYALRSGRTTVDLGVIHRSYDRVVDEDYSRGFFEGYVGLTHRNVRARLYVSPDYLREGLASYYAEVNATLLRQGRVTVEGHAGLSLIPVEQDDGHHRLVTFDDWRLQASYPAGRISLSGGIAGTNYPVYSERGRVRGFVSATLGF